MYFLSTLCSLCSAPCTGTSKTLRKILYIMYNTVSMVKSKRHIITQWSLKLSCINVGPFYRAPSEE